MNWYDILPIGLISAAYKTNGELAWPKESALEVLTILDNTKYLAIGVDVWVPTNAGPMIPTPFIYDWDFNNVIRYPNYPRSAKEFIEIFHWDLEDKNFSKLEPYFNITVSSKDEQGR